MDIPEDFDNEDFADEEPPEVYQMLGMVKWCLSLVWILPGISVTLSVDLWCEFFLNQSYI